MLFQDSRRRWGAVRYEVGSSGSGCWEGRVARLAVGLKPGDHDSIAGTQESGGASEGSRELDKAART
jgi:hypothetical protein